MGTDNKLVSTLTSDPILIGEWTFYADILQLECANKKIKLEPRVAYLLYHLANNSGTPISRENLMEKVWPGMVVGDEALTSAINKLRKAFGDDRHHPEVIETIPKVGYRLIANVDYGNPDKPASEVSQPTTALLRKSLGHHRIALIISGVSLILSALAISTYFFSFSQSNQDLPYKSTETPLIISNSEISEPPVISSSEIFADCDLCPKMIVLPPGRFTMGLEGKVSDADERPAHEVHIDYGFAIGKYEVTFDQWNACVAGGGFQAYQPDDMGWGQGNHPVISVSWVNAQAYVQWLSNRTGKNYRLLTEAEWEYAARAGATTLYPWGSVLDAGKANYGYFRNKPMSIGSYEANNFGLHDMIGNVWEWVEDCYEKNAYESHQDYPAALTGDNNCRHVLRGGSWDVDVSDGADLMRASIRNKAGRESQYANIGIRVARDLE